MQKRAFRHNISPPHELGPVVPGWEYPVHVSSIVAHFVHECGQQRVLRPRIVSVHLDCRTARRDKVVPRDPSFSIPCIRENLVYPPGPSVAFQPVGFQGEPAENLPHAALASREHLEAALAELPAEQPVVDITRGRIQTSQATGIQASGTDTQAGRRSAMSGQCRMVSILGLRCTTRFTTGRYTCGTTRGLTGCTEV